MSPRRHSALLVAVGAAGRSATGERHRLETARASSPPLWSRNKHEHSERGEKIIPELAADEILGDGFGTAAEKAVWGIRSTVAASN